jgi:enoyl-CoA hydratase/carnithine racemase
MNTAEQFHVDQVSPSYWRATFDNGPVNLLDPDTVDQLGALIGRIEDDPDLTVVVFRSDEPGYFMGHWDFLADNARVAGMRPGPTGLHPYLDNIHPAEQAAGRHDRGDPRPRPRCGQRVRARH